MNTQEGGTIAEEYRVNYTVDKVDAVSTSILGLTMKCAQCHDRKYNHKPTGVEHAKVVSGILA